jgi:hypothetical protein
MGFKSAFLSTSTPPDMSMNSNFFYLSIMKRLEHDIYPTLIKIRNKFTNSAADLSSFPIFDFQSTKTSAPTAGSSGSGGSLFLPVFKFNFPLWEVGWKRCPDCVMRAVEGVGRQHSQEQHRACNAPVLMNMTMGFLLLSHVLLGFIYLKLKLYWLIFLLYVFGTVLLFQLVVDP